ncbi:MAG: prepilin peptidase [Clostridiales bacterium]|jgi:leader peptidase (prepilin peptidase)/N-methyltransferase|nr:prepilin peptidase [Clostridiales bacterium]
MGMIFFLFGLVLGSFYNVVIYRLPNSETISKGRSHCPKCGNTLKAIDLVPVLSWVFLRAKCRYCKAPIAWRYPFVELLTGVVFYVSYIFFGFTPLNIIYLPFFSMLIITAFIDFDHMVICEEVLIFCSIVSFIGVILARQGIAGHLLGAAIGFAIYFLVYFGAKLAYKREAFGFGDVILMAAIGLVLGVRDTVLTSLLAFYLCLIMIIITRALGKRIKLKQEIPFGPSMCIAAFITALYGQQIYGLYRHIFGA